MGKAGAGCGEIPRGNSVCPKLLGLDWLVPGEKNKNLGGRKSLWRKEGACRPPASLVYPVFDALWEAASFRGSQPRFLFP